MATLPNASTAVTVTLNAAPATADEGAMMTKCVAVAATTEMPAWVPAIAAFAASVAVSDRVPAVKRMAENVWTPASAAVKV